MKTLNLKKRKDIYLTLLKFKTSLMQDSSQSLISAVTFWANALMCHQLIYINSLTKFK